MQAKVTFLVRSQNAEGRKYAVEDKMTCIIGRGKGCNILIPKEADKKVSRQHCVIEVNPPDARVKDLGSTNGTYVNGTIIGSAEGNKIDAMILLRDGDEVKVGETLISVSVSKPA